MMKHMLMKKTMVVINADGDHDDDEDDDACMMILTAMTMGSMFGRIFT